MERTPYSAGATAGSLRSRQGLVLRHQWTKDGVVASAVGNGAQVLHLSVALCVLNDLYREADRMGVALAGVMVEADGGFDPQWHSTGIEYSVVVDSPAPAADLERLLAAVDAVAEIPRALRAVVPVTRV